MSLHAESTREERAIARRTSGRRDMANSQAGGEFTHANDDAAIVGSRFGP
jgi:hypothetical protein